MSNCIPGREVVLVLRDRKNVRRTVSVVAPARWSKAALLRYVRREHPTETVRLKEWKEQCWASTWMTRLWIVNPKDFSDYPRGIPAHGSGRSAVTE